jgi:hypothetical protein
MDLMSYVRRTTSTARIGASLVVYAGDEVVRAAAAGLRRTASGVGAFVNKASARGERVVRGKRRRRRPAAAAKPQ